MTAPVAPVPRANRSEAGFTLIEAIVATALVIVAVGGTLTALIAALHAVGAAVEDPELAALAQNAIVDLRAVSAYDPAALGALGGTRRTFTTTIVEPSGESTAVTVTVEASSMRAIAAASDAAPTVAVRVTCRDARGRHAEIGATLAREAPAPGSTVELEPAPSPPVTERTPP